MNKNKYSSGDEWAPQKFQGTNGHRVRILGYEWVLTHTNI